MYQPLLIADSGGTKTDWCYVDSHQKKHFFSSESYHPSNWSEEFIEHIKKYWDQFPEYKSAELHFFCAGCLKPEKSEELTNIFQKIGFSEVTVKSDLHAAGVALYGIENGNVAILGTGSVFFKWKEFEVMDIRGGLGFEKGDEGSGFYFGKLLYQAYENSELSIEQKDIFEKHIDIESLKGALINQYQIKKQFSQIAEILKDYKNEFKDWHQENVSLFFESIGFNKHNLQIKIVGGYFAEHSSILIPFLSGLGVEVEEFVKKPIGPLVDYMAHLS